MSTLSPGWSPPFGLVPARTTLRGNLVTRSFKAAAATIAVLLSTAGSALATPTVSVSNQKATFSDSGGTPTTDHVVVTLAASQFPNATDYTFTDGGVSMNPGPGCLPNFPATTTIVCTV